MRNGLPGATLALICLAPLVACSGAEAGQALSGGSSDSDTNGPDRYTFRTRVDMVSLSVTVADRDRRLIPDLTEDDFAIYEDGVKQGGRRFQPGGSAPANGDPPGHLLQHVYEDAAGAGSGNQVRPLAQARRSLQGRGVQRSRDDTRRFHFRSPTSDGRHSPDQPRRSHVPLQRPLHLSPRPRAGEGRVERQAIVVLSDGADTRSLVSFDNVLELAQEIDVLIYTISLRGSPDDLEKQKYSNAKYELEELASETGAVSYSPESIGDLAGVYERIATELKSQYNLGYVSSRGVADGRWRTLQILCDYPNARVRTRSGYFARRARARSSGRN